LIAHEENIDDGYGQQAFVQEEKFTIDMFDVERLEEFNRMSTIAVDK
jgi:hypothetical protein